MASDSHGSAPNLHRSTPTQGVEADDTAAPGKFLTTDEVVSRYRGEVTISTLQNWRAMRIGPSFVKIGKAVLYPVDELESWDRKNMVVCRSSKVIGRSRVTDK